MILVRFNHLSFSCSTFTVTPPPPSYTPILIATPGTDQDCKHITGWMTKNLITREPLYWSFPPTSVRAPRGTVPWMLSHLAHSSMLPMITVQQQQHSLRPPVCIFWSYCGLLVSFSGDFKSLCQILQKHQGYSLRWPTGHSYEGFPHSSVGKNHQPWATLGKFEFFNCAVDLIPAPLQRPLEDKKKLLM